ncbi:MAG: DUF2334 domain-containing protein [Halarchaeum sp.]
MSSDPHDAARWLAGFGATLAVVLGTLLVVALVVQGVTFPAVPGGGGSPAGAAATTPAGTPNASAPNGTEQRATTGQSAGEQSAANQSTSAGPPAWHRYRTIVVFRDDDVQRGWRPDTLRAVHDVFLRTDVPLTDAVIPHIGDGSITESRSLCAYLTGLRRDHPGQFEYALHGYTHDARTGFHGGSEFGDVPYDTQRALIRNGTRELTACTGERPRTFVPPMNTYDDATVRALRASNYTTVSSADWFERSYRGRTGVFTTGGVTHIPERGAFVKNWTSGAFYTDRELEARFDAAYRNRSLYVQMLHYWSFTTDSHRAALRGLIAHMQSKPGVRFMTLGELHRGLANGTIERTEDGWRVRETAARANATGSTRPLANATTADSPDGGANGTATPPADSAD